MITVVDKTDFDNLVFDNNNPDHHIVRTLLSHKSTEFVSNVKTVVAAIRCDNEIWPVTINQTEYENALICSPYTTYITYPLGELKKFTKRGIKILILFNTVCMFMLCRLTQFNKVVQINNNLNSLIKHPKKFITLLPKINLSLLKKFPHHAITFFRVNEVLDKELLNILKFYGYFIFPDRQAHVFFPNTGVLLHSHTKRDLSLLKNSSYQIVNHDELNDEDVKRIVELYRQLFIEKHSKKNPIYTAYYFENAIKNRWHHYMALRNKEGQIDAFISWFEKENIMTCGPLGYDISKDRKTGLYRQLMAFCLKKADENGYIFNMGGGSDEFKSNRGSTKTLEYTAVYYKHLPFYRHIPWKLLGYACNKLLKKFIYSSRS